MENKQEKKVAASNDKKYRFELIGGYYIRNLDEHNWIVAKEYDKKRKDGQINEKIFAYCYDLPLAWYHAVRLNLASAKSHKELKDIVSRLEKLVTLSSNLQE